MELPTILYTSLGHCGSPFLKHEGAFVLPKQLVYGKISDRIGRNTMGNSVASTRISSDFSVA